MFWWVVLFFMLVFFGTFIYLITIHLELIKKIESKTLRDLSMRNQIELLFEEIDDVKLKNTNLIKQLRGQHGKKAK